MPPVLSKIRIYPIKSLDPVEVNSVKIGTRSLLGDRRFALLNDDGGFINGKRTGLVNQLQATFDDELKHVIFNVRGSDEKNTFHLSNDVSRIETFLSDFFKMKVHFIKNEEGRLMDEPDESATTVVAFETMQLLADSLYDPIDTLRLRFRSNIEISNVPPYWEEILASNTSENGIRFKIGEVEMIGISLRARCNVPPRDPFTGDTDKTFIKRMLLSREGSVPVWSHVRELNSLYHLSVNTFIPDSEIGKEIKTGDEVVVFL
jgi:uncharacterized protein